MKLSHVLEIAQYIKSHKPKSLNEGYKSNMVRSICKKIAEQTVYNSHFAYGRIQPKNDKHARCMFTTTQYNILLDYIRGILMNNYADVQLSLIRDLMTDRYTFCKNIMGLNFGDYSSGLYNEFKEYIKDGAENFAYKMRSIPELSHFRLANVEDKYVTEIDITEARKPQYAKGVIFWLDHLGNVRYVSQNNKVLMFITDRGREQYALLTPAEWPESLPKEVMDKIREHLEFKDTSYYKAARIGSCIREYLSSIGALEPIGMSETWEGAKNIKNKFGTTSTKTIIIDDVIAKSEISKCICITAEGFNLNNNEEDDLRRAEYKDFLEFEKTALDKKRHHWKMLIRRCKTIRECVQYVDALEDVLDFSYDLALALGDLNKEQAIRKDPTDGKLVKIIIESENNLSKIVDRTLNTLSKIASLKDKYTGIRSVKDSYEAMTEILADIKAQSEHMKRLWNSICNDFEYFTRYEYDRTLMPEVKTIFDRIIKMLSRPDIKQLFDTLAWIDMKN